MSTPTPPDATSESLFAAWLDRIEAGEEVDLEELCREHPRHEVELLALHRRWLHLQGALDRVGAETTRQAVASGRPIPVDFSSEVLSRLAKKPPAGTRYSIRDEVGHGGMGAVLRVWDEELHRPLAMKVMLGQRVAGASGDTPSPDPLLLARFLEEALVTGQLDHPGIVPVHELGLDAEGRVYFTMKLVQGRTLEQVFDELARGEGSPTHVLGSILKVCEAMSYAHAKGVIHRDLKPSNIMVGRFGEVYVMDWGLAKVLGREGEEDILPGAVPGEDSPLLTMDGDVVGTPAYMPPEQACGNVAAMGPHSDVYAMGAMLYHLQAGHMPYVPAGTTPSSRDVWRRVQEGPPRPLHEVAPQAPPELVALCEKAMSREVDRRYPDMSALSADLTAYVEGRVVQAYETGAWAEARKWVRRNKALAGSLAAVLLAVVVGSVAFAVKADEARRSAEVVLRLSALQTLEDLQTEADELWPAHPEEIDGLRAWIGRAEELLVELPHHRATREDLRALALPGSADGERQDWRFPDEHAEARWWHAQLTELIEGLEGLADEETGLLSPEGTSPEYAWSIPRRLAFACELEAGFAGGGRYAEAWSAALPAIRKAYPGLDLRPQLGLLPLGPDPDSGLWEFAHLASGMPARRLEENGELDLTEDTGLVLVLLEGDTFLMGAQASDPAGPNYDPQALAWEGPVHEVELSSFFLSKYELTRGQWLRLTGQDPSLDVKVSGDSRLLPVQTISWEDCIDWLPRSGLMLPSEARWEYGARAGTDTPWFTGDERDSVWEARAANLGDETAAQIGINQPDIVNDPEKPDGVPVFASVGSFAPNAFGLHDVLGNVSELCLDGFVERFYADSPSLDPVGAWEGAQRIFFRGGSWANNALHARASYRLDRVTENPHAHIGVRPARDLDV